MALGLACAHRLRCAVVLRSGDDAPPLEHVSLSRPAAFAQPAREARRVRRLRFRVHPPRSLPRERAAHPECTASARSAPVRSALAHSALAAVHRSPGSLHSCSPSLRPPTGCSRWASRSCESQSAGGPSCHPRWRRANHAAQPPLSASRFTDAIQSDMLRSHEVALREIHLSTAPLF